MRRKSIRKEITLLSGMIRKNKVSSLRNTIDRLNALIPWEQFRPILERVRRPSPKGGRPSYDARSKEEQPEQESDSQLSGTRLWRYLEQTWRLENHDDRSRQRPDQNRINQSCLQHETFPHVNSSTSSEKWGFVGIVCPQGCKGPL